jgi:hypothetical protein
LRSVNLDEEIIQFLDFFCCLHTNATHKIDVIITVIIVIIIIVIIITSSSTTTTPPSPSFEMVDRGGHMTHMMGVNSVGERIYTRRNTTDKNPHPTHP